MSYILDALKKMEHAKARKKGAAGMTSISGELFRPEKFKPQKSNIWKTVAVVVLVAIVTAGVTWYFLRDNKTSKTAKAMVPVVVPPTQRNVPEDQPVSVPQPVRPVTAITEQTVIPASQVKPEPQPAIAAAFRKSAAERESKKVVSAPVSKQPLVDQSMAPPADIKVSGIAWQDERAARRAVVNGFLLKEGAIVGGAKIIEILPGKVRFSMSGKVFELSMHSSGIAGDAK